MTDQDLQNDIDDALANDPQVLWGSRLIKRALFDADGSTLGSIQDILLIPAANENKLYLRGFLALVDRRLIFVHEARVDAVDRDGLHLRGGTLDLRLFKRRPGELLLAEDVYGTEIDNQKIRDVGLSQKSLTDGKWLTLSLIHI